MPGSTRSVPGSAAGGSQSTPSLASVAWTAAPTRPVRAMTCTVRSAALSATRVDSSTGSEERAGLCGARTGRGAAGPGGTRGRGVRGVRRGGELRGGGRGAELGGALHGLARGGGRRGRLVAAAAGERGDAGQDDEHGQGAGQ